MNDTVELLKECNSGVKMGVSSIDEVIDKVRDPEFRKALNECKEKHQQIGSRTHELLNRFDESGKEPNVMAKGMSWLKTNIMISMNETDETIADIITDGCNMGVKSLNRYLNKYKAADEEAKKLAKELVELEANFASDISKYL